MAHHELNSTPPPALGSVLEFMRELWLMEHQLASVSKRMQADLGVTGLQRLVIRVIGKFPGLSAGDLSSILYTHPSTLSGVLRRLEAANAIHRDTHPRDKRRVQLSLTAKGRKLDSLQEGTVEACVRRVLESVPPARINNVGAVLRLLSAELAKGFQLKSGARVAAEVRRRTGRQRV